MGSQDGELTALLVEIRKDLLEVRSELANLRKQLFEIKSAFSDSVSEIKSEFTDKNSVSKKEELETPTPRRLSLVGSRPSKFSTAQLLQEGLKRGMFKKK